jgi:radical SAM superfamily enzyme YgiQ (UPF0313 family)
MPDIVLATLNAKYLHAAFGLRCLLANLAELRSRTVLLEFDLSQRPLDIVEKLLAQQPRIIGLGVAIWNVRESLEVVTLLKQLRPQITLVLGGPEVSYETDDQPICHLADFVLTGEADLAFPVLCRQILEDRAPAERILHAPLPDLCALQLPYDEYTDHDLAHRVVYLEASRGCPFTCEFCLSSLDLGVRAFPLDPLLAALGKLLDRGLRHFKFVDRTFNLNLRTSRTLLEFFLEHPCPGLSLHFEMIPDRLPGQLRDLIRRFPPGSLQFEVGIQTFNPEVAHRIRRRQDYARTEDNLRFLRRETGVHLHTDLILGLPGETLESFACGFDRLIDLQPQEIQVGLLKRLRGTPIARHDTEWGMTYRQNPPYDLLENRLLPFPTLQRLRRFARAWDLVGNSGNFVSTLPLIWHNSASPFQAFLSWTDWLQQAAGRLHALALDRLTTFLYRYLTEIAGHPPDTVLDRLQQDYHRTGRGSLPPELRTPPPIGSAKPHPSRALRRQQRHRLTPDSQTGHPTADQVGLST